MELVVATPETAHLLKQVRLSALRDEPAAFCASLAHEEALTDDEWRIRAAAWTSDRAISYIACESGTPVGIIAGKMDVDPTRAHLLSMWVAPSHRGTGMGSRLVHAVEAWARSKHVTELWLEVTPANEGVARFYAGNGFAPASRSEAGNLAMRKLIG